MSHAELINRVYEHHSELGFKIGTFKVTNATKDEINIVWIAPEDFTGTGIYNRDLFYAGQKLGLIVDITKEFETNQEVKNLVK